MTCQLHLCFEPTTVNLGRKSGFGIWRVWRTRTDRDPGIFADRFGPRDYLIVPSVREYKRGQIVNPRKLVIDYLNSERGSK